MVADDRRRCGQIVAMGVVAMMVGVDDRLNGSVGHGCHRIEERPGAGLGRRRVDQNHTVGPDNEAGVVDEPGAVVLHIGIGIVGDLHDFGLNGGGTHATPDF